MRSIFETIVQNLLIFQIITSILKVTVGVGLCFGALKWRRGALTGTAIAWGAVLGLLAAILFGNEMGRYGGIICIVAGIIILPVLTYTVPGVNRFVLGFLVSSKLFFMLTTVLAKEDAIDGTTAFTLPLIAGTFVGLGLMAWVEMRVSAFIMACSFIGASEIAPEVSEWVNRILFSVTGDYGYIFDPTDLLFAFFKIELTDQWTLIAMIVLMIWGAHKQITQLKENNIPLDTPLIGFESPYGKNGRIYMDGGPIDTL